MMKISNILGILMLISLFVLMSACEYDHPEPEALPDVVSFSNDIMPIFNSSCNFSGCHNAGGEAPDLSPENAYDALTAGNYINLDAPEQSELYTVLQPGGSMAAYTNAGKTALVLAWIKAGAENN